MMWCRWVLRIHLLKHRLSTTVITALLGMEVATLHGANILMWHCITGSRICTSGRWVQWITCLWVCLPLGLELFRRSMSITIPYLAKFLHYEIVVPHLEIRSGDIYLEDLQDDCMNGESVLHLPFIFSYISELQFFQETHQSLWECGFEVHPSLVVDYLSIFTINGSAFKIEKGEHQAQWRKIHKHYIRVTISNIPLLSIQILAVNCFFFSTLLSWVCRLFTSPVLVMELLIVALHLLEL